jgi:hypothetical protein
MRSLARKILDKEIWFLRIAVVFPVVWAGIRSILEPDKWLDFIPPIINNFIDPGTFLIACGFVWIIAAVGILAGFWRPFFVFSIMLGLVCMLMFYGIDDITFRDVGLVIVAFILFLKESV